MRGVEPCGLADPPGTDIEEVSLSLEFTDHPDVQFRDAAKRVEQGAIQVGAYHFAIQSDSSLSIFLGYPEVADTGLLFTLSLPEVY